jgi:recombination protein RecA
LAKRKKDEDETQYTSRQALYAGIKNKYGDVTKKYPVEAVPRHLILPSPSISLNIATREGGFRPGSIVEVYGVPGVTKSRMAAEMCREAQKHYPDKGVAFLDLEQDADLYSFQNLGIDMRSFEDGTPKFLYWPHPQHQDMPSVEEVLDFMYLLASSGQFSFIAFDSVAMAISRLEMESEEVTESKYAGAAKELGKGFRRIKHACAKTGTIIWAINQVRTTFTSSPRGTITGQEPGGGWALKFASSHRFRLKWTHKQREDEPTILHIEAEKLKYAQSGATVDIPIDGGNGIDQVADLVNSAEKYGIIQKSGAWYKYDGKIIGQGLYGAKETLVNDIPLKEEIYKKTMDAACPETTVPYVPEPEPEVEE